jgi:YgiT-type zinc finger domain-containing protein
MICDVCGKTGTKIRRVTRSCGKGKTAFLIEAVPVVSCPRCGEGYLTAKTLRESGMTLDVSPARKSLIISDERTTCD